MYFYRHFTSVWQSQTRLPFSDNIVRSVCSHWPRRPLPPPPPLIHVFKSQQTVRERRTDVCFRASLRMMRLVFFHIQGQKKKNLTYTRPSSTLRNRCDFIMTSPRESECKLSKLKTEPQVLVSDHEEWETHCKNETSGCQWHVTKWRRWKNKNDKKHKDNNVQKPIAIMLNVKMSLLWWQ